MAKKRPDRDRDDSKVFLKCRGGRSYGCRHLGEHNQIKPKVCFRCQTYLGCSVCAEIDEELICLNCDRNLNPPGNWGAKVAMEKHGPIVRDKEKVIEGLKIIQMRLRGSITDQDQTKLFGDLFRSRKTGVFGGKL